jgi:hypothetical protein
MAHRAVIGERACAAFVSSSRIDASALFVSGNAVVDGLCDIERTLVCRGRATFEGGVDAVRGTSSRFDRVDVEAGLSVRGEATFESSVVVGQRLTCHAIGIGRHDPDPDPDRHRSREEDESFGESEREQRHQKIDALSRALGLEPFARDADPLDFVIAALTRLVDRHHHHHFSSNR